MIKPIVVTSLPFLFLVILFSGGEFFRHRNIDMDGEAPINRTLFCISKYAFVLIWGAMILQSWGVNDDKD